MSVEYIGSPLSWCDEEEFALKPHNNLFQAFREQNQAKLKFWVGLQSHINFSQFFSLSYIYGGIYNILLRFILLTKHLEQVTTQRLLDPNS